MKIKHLTEYTNASSDEWNNEGNVSAIKNDCRKFISEFLSNNIRVYRGLNNFSTAELHLIETQSYRTVHGSALHNKLLRDSFERFLTTKGVSRYKNSVSSIAYDPEHYEGIDLEGWFYFIPMGDYQYHYYSGVDDGDINVESDAFYSMSQLGDSITGIINDYNYIKHRIASREPLGEIFSPHDNASITKTLSQTEKMIDIISDIFMAGQDDVEFLKDFVMSIPNFTRLLTDEKMKVYYNDLYADVRGIISSDYLSDMLDIRKSLTVNELPVGVKSEIVFTCKRYYAIPYSEEGDDFIRRLTA